MEVVTKARVSTGCYEKVWLDFFKRECLYKIIVYYFYTGIKKIINITLSY